VSAGVFVPVAPARQSHVYALPNGRATAPPTTPSLPCETSSLAFATPSLRFEALSKAFEALSKAFEALSKRFEASSKLFAKPYIAILTANKACELVDFQGILLH